MRSAIPSEVGAFSEQTNKHTFTMRPMIRFDVELFGEGESVDDSNQRTKTNNFARIDTPASELGRIFFLPHFSSKCSQHKFLFQRIFLEKSHTHCAQVCLHSYYLFKICIFFPFFVSVFGFGCSVWSVCASPLPVIEHTESQNCANSIFSNGKKSHRSARWRNGGMQSKVCDVRGFTTYVWCCLALVHFMVM